MTAADTNANTSASRKGGANKQLRDLQRAVHLVGGLLLAAYIYTPLRDLSTFGLLVQFVVVPVVVATGMAMWQLPRLRRALQPRTRAAATTRGGRPE